MTHLKLIITIILGGLALTGCQKEEVQIPTDNVISTNSLDESKLPNPEPGGGDEDELIIIYGVTENTLSNPVASVEVILYDEGSNNPLDTTTTSLHGEFEFDGQLPGVYYFIANANGFQTLVTETMVFPDSNVATLTLEDE